MVWLNKVKKPSSTILLRVIVRPKGWILVGEDWDTFVWHDSKRQIQLENALAKALATSEPIPVLHMEPQKDGKIKFKVLEFTCNWFKSDQGFISSLDPVKSEDEEPDELF